APEQKGTQPRVLLVRDGEKLVGGLALMLRRERIFGGTRPVLTFMGNEWSPQANLVLTEPSAEPAIEALLAHLEKSGDAYDLVRLGPLVADAKYTRRLQAAAES